LLPQAGSSMRLRFRSLTQPLVGYARDALGTPAAMRQAIPIHSSYCKTYRACLRCQAGVFSSLSDRPAKLLGVLSGFVPMPMLAPFSGLDSSEGSLRRDQRPVLLRFTGCQVGPCSLSTAPVPLCKPLADHEHAFRSSRRSGGLPSSARRLRCALKATGQTIAWFAFCGIHRPSWRIRVVSSGLPLPIRLWSRALALLEVPKSTRAAIVLAERVVSFLGRASVAAVPGGGLGKGSRKNAE